MKKAICIICMMMLIVGCQSQNQKLKDEGINNQPEQIVEKEDKQVQTDDKINESSKEQDKQDKKDGEVKNTEKDNKTNTSSTSQKDKKMSKEEKTDKANTSSFTKPTNQSDKNNQTENDSKKPTQPSKPNTDEKKEEKPHRHVFAVNGGWFQTQIQAEARFDEELKKWDEKLENKEITWEEYGQKCPCGYEVFRCTCGMHGLNYSYER